MRATLAMMILMSAIAPATAFAAPPTPAQSAKAFVDGIYRSWTAALARHQEYAPPDDTRIWTPEMAHLFALDAAAVRRTGDVAVIDYVVLCSCQDDAGLHAASSVVSANESAAAVRVALTFDGGGTQTMMLRLQKLPAGWRIADVVTTGHFGGSLRQQLHDGLDPHPRGRARR